MTFFKTIFPRPQRVPAILPPATPNPPPDPIDEAIHSQKYWERRRKFLQSLAVWTQQELLIAERNERTTLETPSAPKTRR